MDTKDLIFLDGLFYKKYTELPFTGKTTGQFQGTYKNGILNGPYTEFYESGKLKLKGIYKNGKKEGFWFLYYYSVKPKKLPNDNDVETKVCEKVFYENNELNGPFSKSYDNDFIFEEGNYLNGKLDGIIKTYDEVYNKKTKYKNGLKDGTEFTYYNNGILSSRTDWEKGEILLSALWDEDGNFVYCHIGKNFSNNSRNWILKEKDLPPEK